MHELRIGTAGWSYPSGAGTWNGIFYPPGSSRRGRRFDELAYYAERFDTVEVNSSFYRVPSPAVTRSWARRTPPGFAFSLKLFQKFTHPAMFQKATGREGVPGQADIDEWRRAADPLAEAGKLGALLAQFPPSFKSSPSSTTYLDWLLRALGGCPVAVELRHRSWSDDVGATLALLNGLGAAWVQIDEPKFRFSIQQNFLPNVTTFCYMRLHGRNRAAWWKHASAEDRYDYLYSSGELRPFADVAGAARTLVRRLYLYFNNHFSAKAVANAVEVKRMLDQEIPGDYPPEFLARYPHLAGVVRPSTKPLLPVS